MASLAVLNTVLLLRIFTLIALVVSVVLMVLNKAEDVDGSKTRFYDIIGFRYTVAVGGIGVVYTLIQIPFAIYNVAQERRLVGNGFLHEFDFYGDKLVAFLLATGVGVGFAIPCEFVRFFLLTDQGKKFLNMAKISTGVLLAGFVSMALLCVFSAHRWSSYKKGFFK